MNSARLFEAAEAKWLQALKAMREQRFKDARCLLEESRDIDDQARHIERLAQLHPQFTEVTR